MNQSISTPTLAIVKPMRAVPSKPKTPSSGIPKYYRERLSNTTLGKFRQRLALLISALDTEDPDTRVRQFIAIHKDEMQISGWVNNCFISLTIDTQEDAL